MLDRKWLIQNQEAYETSCKKRNIQSQYDLFLEKEKNLKEIIKIQEKKRFEQKQIKNFNEQAVALKNELIKLNEKKDFYENDLNNWLMIQPNIVLEEAPYGIDEKDNKVVFESHFSKKTEEKHHEDIIKNLIMKDESVNLSGSRFVIFKKSLSKLKNALAKFMIENNEKFGYELYSVPYLVNESALYGTGQLPKFSEDAFKTTENKWLISTGEVSLLNMFKDYVFQEFDLPKLCMTYSPCFRSEAGSGGRDTKGIIRLHQFHKVELVSICKPEDANAIHQKQLECAKNILNTLKLPYQVLLLCAADSAFTASLQYDIEVWMPGMNKFVEIASCSQCSNFQAIRTNIKYKTDKKNEFVYTLNGSSLPIERLIAAICENYYFENKILIPDCLQDELKGKYINVETDEIC